MKEGTATEVGCDYDFLETVVEGVDADVDIGSTG